MEILNIFGQILSNNIKAKLIASKGIIRFAFRDADLPPESLKYEDYKEVFSKFLKIRLERVGINNPEEVVSYMLSQLVKNQSVFALSA